MGEENMKKKKPKPDLKMQAWIDARKRRHLSHAQVQMARELGMNPKTLGKIDNHDQEPWKMPLKNFIEHLYFKRFGKTHPEVVMSIEDKIRLDAEKKARKREQKLERRLNGAVKPLSADERRETAPAETHELPGEDL